VDYKALIALSLPRVPHFCARRGPSLNVIHVDTTSVSITMCFLVS
jgi:phage terminase Nu1 subunit (DNA packaging protein)